MTKNISKSEVKKGFKKCHSVIKRLLDDAENNLKNNRLPTAIALAILAYEEMAKADLLRTKMVHDEELNLEEWETLSYGKKAHFLKLSWYPTKRKEKVLNKWSDLDIRALSEANSKLGFLPNYPNKAELLKEIEISEKINPKLNKIKQDCFYVKWDKKDNKWISFDNLFSDKVMRAIATFLIFEGRHNVVMQKFSLIYPRKLVKDWAEEDWKKLKNSELSKEIIKLQKKILNERKKGNIDIVLTALTNYDK